MFVRGFETGFVEEVLPLVGGCVIGEFNLLPFRATNLKILVVAVIDLLGLTAKARVDGDKLTKLHWLVRVQRFPFG